MSEWDPITESFDVERGNPDDVEPERWDDHADEDRNEIEWWVAVPPGNR